MIACVFKCMPFEESNNPSTVTSMNLIHFDCTSLENIVVVLKTKNYISKDSAFNKSKTDIQYPAAKSRCKAIRIPSSVSKIDGCAL